MAVQFSVFLGAEVYAVDMRPSSRDLALHFGARKAFDLVELDGRKCALLEDRTQTTSRTKNNRSATIPTARKTDTVDNGMDSTHRVVSFSR